ncbi:hypothetical protein [Haloarcula pellucida]|uniref:Uncharacterized protein n=1 Tax=Haloarcula pellucida TaxID=1427151 RepID=A0A830GPD9_9EURY|nr:hypothetical protein [Halomicroarcula pellucida]MBX0348061.1 hypothetical protein [Halomicroarcula pellucida]GGN96725.1 hypothetical protein GCM10009030_25340 [Halomicroarcula pellucida]
MATQETPSFDDLEPVESNSDDDYDSEWIELEPGENVVGVIRDVVPNCGQYDTTVIELSRGIGDVVAMWSNNQIDNALDDNDLGEGDVVGIKHTEKTRTFTTDDGEEREYDVWEVRQLGGSE